MIKNVFWSFFWKERIWSSKSYIRVKGIPSETLHVYSTLNLLVNFSVSTTYKQPILLIFRTLSQNLGKFGSDGKEWCSYSYSAEEKLTDNWKFGLGNFFLQACVGLQNQSKDDLRERFYHETDFPFFVTLLFHWLFQYSSFYCLIVLSLWILPHRKKLHLSIRIIIFLVLIFRLKTAPFMSATTSWKLHNKSKYSSVIPFSVPQGLPYNFWLWKSWRNLFRAYSWVPKKNYFIYRKHTYLEKNNFFIELKILKVSFSHFFVLQRLVFHVLF